MSPSCKMAAFTFLKLIEETAENLSTIVSSFKEDAEALENTPVLLGALHDELEGILLDLLAASEASAPKEECKKGHLTRIIL